jgi:hypothetical protein
MKRARTAKFWQCPTDKILSIYTQWQKPEDLNPLRLKTIAHFFEHYKDLEEGKWVKIFGWEGPESAKKEILDGIADIKRPTPKFVTSSRSLLLRGDRAYKFSK